MSKTLLPAGSLFLALAAFAGGQSPAPKPAPDPEAEKWVARLGDPDYQTRDEAAKALRKLGGRALPALQAARKHTDPEVRRRAEELAAALESAALFAPRRVTLAVKQKSAREAVAALAKEAGYTIDCWGTNESQKLDFAWKDVPFWEALDGVCQAAGLIVQQGYGDDRLRLQAQSRAAHYVSRDGAFRVAAGGLQQLRSVDFSSLPQGGAELRRTDSLTFNFTVHAEPRLPLLGAGEVKLTAAYDSENRSLVPAGPAAPETSDGGFPVQRVSRYHGGGKALSIPADIALAKPSPKATAIKLLRGTVPITVLVEQRPEVVSAKLRNGLTAKAGTTTFAIEDVSENAAKQPQLKMTVSEEGAGNDYTWSNSLYNRLEVYDEKGGRMQNHGSSWTHRAPNQVQITFTYGRAGAGNLGKPTKLVYHVWKRMQHQIGFEFKDLPLP